MSGAETLIVENQVVMMVAMAALADTIKGCDADLDLAIKMLEKRIETSDNEVRRAANEGVGELAKAGA